MARTRSLTEIVQAVWHETGRIDYPQANSSDYTRLLHHINRVQRTLYEGYEWRHLRHFEILELSVGQRFYDFPDTIDRERILSVHRLQDDRRPISKLVYGITSEQYYIRNSLVDERQDPPERWALADVDGASQFEIWPIPQTRNYEVLIEGLRPLRQLAGPADLSQLDGDLIALFVAAERLGEKGGPAKAALANQRLEMLKAGDAAATEPFAIGSGKGARDDSRHRSYYSRIDFAPRR